MFSEEFLLDFRLFCPFVEPLDRSEWVFFTGVHVCLKCEPRRVDLADLGWLICRDVRLSVGLLHLNGRRVRVGLGLKGNLLGFSLLLQSFLILLDSAPLFFLAILAGLLLGNDFLGVHLFTRLRSQLLERLFFGQLARPCLACLLSLGLLLFDSAVLLSPQLLNSARNGLLLGCQVLFSIDSFLL